MEELDEDVKQKHSIFKLLKSLLLIKLGKYDKAESVFDGHIHFDVIYDDVCHSFIKVMKHDFTGAKKFLEKWKLKYDVNKILDYVFFYEKKWNDFNQKKKNSSSLFNQNEEITKSLKDCVEMKKIVVKMYDDFFLYRFVMAI